MLSKSSEGMIWSKILFLGGFEGQILFAHELKRKCYDMTLNVFGFSKPPWKICMLLLERLNIRNLGDKIIWNASEHAPENLSVSYSSTYKLIPNFFVNKIDAVVFCETKMLFKEFSSEIICLFLIKVFDANSDFAISISE